MCPIHIEYFPGAEENGVILLYGRDPEAVARLREQVASLAASQLKRVAVHEIPGFEPVADCRLFFSAARSDCGTYWLGEKNDYECELERVSWEDIYEKLETFTEQREREGLQWLDSSYGGMSVIISDVRGW